MQNIKRNMKRYRIKAFGEVQGVFFRVFCRENADKLGLKGYARNMPDNTVEIVVEGDENKIKQFMGLCRKGPKAAAVDKIEVKEEEFRGEFDSFTIRY